MALGVEAAELMEHFQWVKEADSAELSAEQREGVAEELADVLLYLIRLADKLNVDLGRAARAKLELNAKKYPVDLARGSSRKYTSYGPIEARRSQDKRLYLRQSTSETSKELKIESFVKRLSRLPTLAHATNPYSREALASNLRNYLSLLLSFPYSGHLLVGEAPGYKGCAKCGIPFTSERVLSQNNHPFILALRERITITGSATEVTATKVWNQLDGKLTVPAFWNVFPFHPWVPGNVAKNRKPNPAETEIGMPYLDTVVDILRPHTIVAVGQVANRVLQYRYPKLRYASFSHPSMGGYQGFLTGFGQLGLR